MFDYQTITKAIRVVSTISRSEIENGQRYLFDTYSDTLKMLAIHQIDHCAIHQIEQNEKHGKCLIQ